MYRVGLTWGDAAKEQVLGVNCECPHFEGGNLCKHIWATIVLMGSRKLSGLVPGGRSLTLRHDSFEVDVQDDSDDFDDHPVGRPTRTTRHAREPAAVNPAHRATAARAPVPGPDWRALLSIPDSVSAEVRERTSASQRPLGPIYYVVHRNATLTEAQLVLTFCAPVSDNRGHEGRFQGVALALRDLDLMVESSDRELLALLLGALTENESSAGRRTSASLTRAARCRLHPALAMQILPKLIATGRLMCESGYEKGTITMAPLTGDIEASWTFRLIVESETSDWVVTGCLERGNERLELAELDICLPDGIAIVEHQILRWQPLQDIGWMELLRRLDRIRVPKDHRSEFLERLWNLKLPQSVSLPEDLRLEEVAVTPALRLVFRFPPSARPQMTCDATCHFDYDGFDIRPGRSESLLPDPGRNRLVRRDPLTESRAAAELAALGFESSSYPGLVGVDVRLPAAHFPEAVATLLASGWQILAEGRHLRAAVPSPLRVRSGTDWFDLEGDVRFGEELIPVGRLLEALRRGESMIALGDGTSGVLPGAWLKQLAPLAHLASEAGDSLRYRRSQATLLDALLAVRPDVDLDATFRDLRTRLEAHRTIEPAAPPTGFTGALRPYQQTGLGWFRYLRDVGFGGCLADDMGLGKTVQVLALLEERRTRRLRKLEERRPSLVVVPRSLVHNWISEAARFTPRLKVMDYTGPLRHERKGEFHDHDLILSTYGTLLRDIPDLSQVHFDYAILDEAQAIKNGMSQAAKASLLLNADHRLAMSGTPIQNHLGELASLFEFLNPGLLGRSTAARSLLAAAPTDDASLQALAKALQPFILRRTKEGVLEELPPKTEQTIYCELGTRERRLYDSLRKHFRDSLTRRIAADGVNRSRMHVLEALLRLRQAACHPALVEKTRSGESSAKIDALLENLEPVIAEGHKALVFSQFTSLLALVRDRLDRAGIRYEYLDGRTRDRELRIERFQIDPDCPVFLISLKAGGLGLNLTAASYVYILDPWWNPAVEAQAVDRAHRMGQSHTVFAYRLITLNTVEEKILDLQRSKLKLAEALISSNTTLLKTLTAADIDLLLS